MGQGYCYSRSVIIIQTNTNLRSSEKFSFNPISPIFIGTGEDVDRAELSIENKVVYRSYLKTLYKSVDYKTIDNLIVNAIEQPTNEHPELEAFVKKFADYKVKAAGDVDKSLLYYESIKSNDNLYIPGSSLKGAILTALVNHSLEFVINGSQRYHNFFRDVIQNKIKTRVKKSQLVITLALMYVKYGENILDKFPDPDMIVNKNNYDDREIRKNNALFDQWLQISDTNLYDPKTNAVVRRFRRYGSRTEGQLPDINIEAIHYKNISFDFEMKLQKNDLNLSLSDILKITDEFYNESFELEGEWFRNNELHPYSKPNDVTGYLLRIGHGVGHSSISIYNTIKKCYDSSVLESYGRVWKITKSFSPEPRTKLLAGRMLKKGEISFRQYSVPLGWAIISPKSIE